MQNVSDDEGKHIITASNVNKRLSFRGREKFVEVFSQAKNNYRWAELSQLIATPVDQAISWSSSDDELDESVSQSQRGRHLPNRTLTSHINFGDCKLVRKGVHRHSSAQFVRSIEKRPRERAGKPSSRVLPEKGRVCERSDSPPNMPDISFRRGHSLRDSASLDQCDIWEKNLSILNQTVNLTPDCSENQNSAARLGQHQPSPKRTEPASKFEATSPILAPRTNRIRRKRISHKNDKKPSEDADTGCVSKEIPSSPIFKTGQPKRRSIKKVIKSGAAKFENKTDKTVCEVGVGTPVKPTFTVSPKDSNRPLEIPASPVIGRTMKRQKRMVVDKDMSPILGCKDVHRPLKIPKVSCHLKKDSICANSNNIIDCSLRDEKSVCEPSITGISLLNEAKFVVDEEESKLLPSQNKAAAKRSLDFSFEKNMKIKDIIDCDNNDPQVERSRPGQNCSLNDSVCDLLINESNCDKSSVQTTLGHEKILHAFDVTFNNSNLIEDANTEKIDAEYVCDKFVKSPSFQKRNRLSLNKKSPAMCFLTKVNKPAISAASSRATTFPEILSHKVTRISSRHENNLDSQLTAIATNQHSSRKQSNHTLFIEEDLSEPMENVTPDAFGSPVSSRSNDVLRNHIASLTAKLFEEETGGSASGSQIESDNFQNDDADIDSCSSLSPEASQLEEIERLPSSAVSTLVAISQTSSPLAPSNIGSLPAEKVADDFNAPPKKGKTKLKPDGLANRLQRLLNRQRSSARIWQFKRTKQSKETSASAGCSEQSSSIILTVDKTWTEYSHIIVQGHISNDSFQNRASRYLEALSDQVVVFLDPTIAEKLERVMSSSSIRIFPPWQSLKLKGISLILCAYCIEVVSQNSKPEGTETEISYLLKEGSECVSSIKLSEIIFPKLVEIQTHLIQVTEGVTQERHEKVENAATPGSISSLVSHHYIGGAFSDALTLTILRVFQFRPLETDNGQGIDSPSWSLLGQDVFGEVCEVLLGCEQFQSSEESIWQGVKTGKVIGETYCFSGFVPIQRIAPFRVSNLWKVISSMEIQGLCDQPVFYVLSSATLSWSCRLSETQRKTYIYRPNFSTLISIFSEASSSEARRVNVFCCILHATKERLYITDLETSPSITVVAVSPTAYLPSCIFKTTVLVVLDLEVTRTELKIDKYSKVSSKEDISVLLEKKLIDVEQQRCLGTLNPNLPLLHRSAPARTLAMFFGTIVGVDEETAYMWPACGICENELLSLGDGTEIYRCEKCNNQCDNFVKHMSLQVLCICPNLPPTSSVRIKLHQVTIESLLPSTLCNEEGYDMNSVIGQKLGPIRCEVVHSKDGNFTLQELPKLS